MNDTPKTPPLPLCFTTDEQLEIFTMSHERHWFLTEYRDYCRRGIGAVPAVIPKFSRSRR